MAEVNPTRMELIKTKERIKLAKKGYKLLKQKRDALILEFFNILKKAKDLRSKLNESLKDSYHAIFLAEAYHTPIELEAISLSCKKDIWLDIEVKNVMGVKIPEIRSGLEGLKSGRGYSIAGSSAKIDYAVSLFENVLDMAVRLAETETAIKRLILEIEKTKRRVNALDYILIPKLEAQMKDISFRLEEMERDSFVSLKVIKRKLEKERKKTQ